MTIQVNPDQIERRSDAIRSKRVLLEHERELLFIRLKRLRNEVPEVHHHGVSLQVNAFLQKMDDALELMFKAERHLQHTAKSFREMDAKQAAMMDQNDPNAFVKSINSFKNIGTSFVDGNNERWEKKFDSPYDLFNYMTYGAIEGFHTGMVDRNENKMNSFYDFSNWLSLGLVEMVDSAINPDDPFSEEHWLSSLGLAGIVTGWVRLVRSPTVNTPVKNVQSKSTGKFTSTSDAARVISKNLGGTVTPLKNGYKIEIPNANSRKPIVVRVMNKGSGGRIQPYYRVSVDGKGSYTLDGKISNDRGLTHIDMSDDYLIQVIKIVNSINGK